MKLWKYLTVYCTNTTKSSLVVTCDQFRHLAGCSKCKKCVTSLESVQTLIRFGLILLTKEHVGVQNAKIILWFLSVFTVYCDVWLGLKSLHFRSKCDMWLKTWSYQYCIIVTHALCKLFIYRDNLNIKYVRAIWHLNIW